MLFFDKKYCKYSGVKDPITLKQVDNSVSG
jgi:hypothetical protein